MDAIAGLLDGQRARGAFLLRSELRAPWSLWIRDRAPLTVMAVVRGQAWVVSDHGATPLRAGDVVLARGPDPYTVADDPSTPHQVVIEPGEVCRPVSGAELRMTMDRGTRTWRNTDDPDTTLLTGTYERHSATSAALLDALPPVTVLRRGELDTPLVDLLDREIVRNDPGQQSMLDRLLDLIVVDMVRSWFARPDVEAPGWWQAMQDPVVGRVIDLMHDQPEQPWTIASLAAAAHVSRAQLARRFQETVGEPPITYLTRWRMALAADLLGRPGATLAAAAGAVGYSTPYALSSAFKRHHGVSPSQYRRPPS